MFTLLPAANQYFQTLKNLRYTKYPKQAHLKRHETFACNFAKLVLSSTNFSFYDEVWLVFFFFSQRKFAAYTPRYVLRKCSHFAFQFHLVEIPQCQLSCKLDRIRAAYNFIIILLHLNLFFLQKFNFGQGKMSSYILNKRGFF